MTEFFTINEETIVGVIHFEFFGIQLDGIGGRKMLVLFSEG